MSASYVRTTVRGWAATAATTVSVPFYDTINFEQDPKDVLWWTVEFDVSFSEKLTFCNDWSEEGSIEVLVMARPGAKDTDAIDAAERIRDELLKQKDPTGRLVLAAVASPSEFSGGSGESRWYQVLVSIPYRNQSKK